MEFITPEGQKELYFPIFCVFLGDMMELCCAGRNMSANFSKLSMPCYICKKPGCKLSDLSPAEYRSLQESDAVIANAIALLRDGHSSKATDLLKKHSLLPVPVRSHFCDEYGLLYLSSCRMDLQDTLCSRLFRFITTLITLLRVLFSHLAISYHSNALC